MRSWSPLAEYSEMSCENSPDERGAQGGTWIVSQGICDGSTKNEKLTSEALAYADFRGIGHVLRIHWT